jgi:hypothetical protein
MDSFAAGMFNAVVETTFRGVCCVIDFIS